MPLRRSLDTRQVHEIMKRNFIRANRKDSLRDVLSTMRMGRVRHIPVVEDETALVGIASYRSLLELCCDGLQNGGFDVEAPIERIMSTPPYSIPPHVSLAEAAERMLHLQIGCLPVVVEENGQSIVQGIVSKSDLLRAAYVTARD